MAYFKHTMDSKDVYENFKLLNICRRAKTEIPSELSDVNAINQFFVNSGGSGDRDTGELIHYILIV